MLSASRLACQSFSSAPLSSELLIQYTGFPVVRKERLELPRLSAPAPKAGASTNSATFAADFAKRDSIAETPFTRYVTGPIEAPTSGHFRAGRSLRKLSRRVVACAGRAASGHRRDLPFCPCRGRYRRRGECRADT